MIMKPARLLTFFTAAWATGFLYAQNPADALIEPVTDPVNDLQVSDLLADGAANTFQDIPEEELSDLPPPAAIPDAIPDAMPPTDDATEVSPATGAPFGPLEEQKQEMQKSDEGFIIKDAGLNDIFQFLAKSAQRQYFHNAKIAGPEFLVTGHLNDGNPLQQMEELAFMYGLSLHTKGDTIYALTQAQLSQLPSSEFHYQLRYLRPTDMEQIKELLKPMLTPGTGIVNFEPKTNTIIIIDTANRIEQVQELLHGIDKAKGQIIVETKIFRVNTGAAERTGVDWSSSLGKDGTNLGATLNLNKIFGLPGLGLGDDGGIGDVSVVLSPVQISGVLRALAEGGLTSQVSNPTLITEDNEQAVISIIDRIPIITTTSTQATSGGNPTVTEEVRYKIDAADKTIDTDPEHHREIGISLVVTPTLLPDGTVRMKMRPRSAQIVEQIKSVTGNEYPRVTESMVESITRVPDGYSLVIGGFYGEAKVDGDTKVPILGDIPVLNFFFKSKSAVKENTSLVFVVTPTSYDPTSSYANRNASNRLHTATVLDCDATWVNPDNPGPAHAPNMKRSVRGLQPTQAPYYPRSDEMRSPSTSSQSKSTSSKPRFARGKR